MISAVSATSDTDEIVKQDVTHNEISHTTADNDDVAETNTNTNTNVNIGEKKTANSETSKMSNSNDKSIKSDANNAQTYTNLSNAIESNISAGIYTITLKSDYIYDSSIDSEDLKTGIIISNDGITIDGNGHTINGHDEARCFIIKGVEVTLKNINFINGAGTDYAGAIYWIAASGTIENCNFTNNQARNGGAIYWGKYFESSSEEEKKISENGIIINSNFNSNHANMGNGGAIYWYANNGKITNSHFNSNYVSMGDGGAIFWAGHNGNITNNCDFINNKADNSGGAIYWTEDDGAINNCNFNNNTAINKYGNSYVGGGAIHWHANNGNITNCYFINNTEKSQPFWQKDSCGGGAIYLPQDNNYVSACIFINNSAYEYGSAIWCENSLISNCIFLNNSLSNPEASEEIIIFKHPSSSYLTVDYSWFGNTADNYTNPSVGVTLDNWLFLNATISNDSIMVSSTSDIIFKLSSYNGAVISDYDNNLLAPINLTITATKGNIANTAILGNKITYTATNTGEDSITANIENIRYTIKVNNKAKPTPTPTPTPTAKLNTNIIASEKTFTLEDKNKKYGITLKDRKGQLLKNVKATLNIKGKTYTAKTNSKGVATFKITLNRKGTYITTITYAGDKTHKQAVKKVKLTANPFIISKDSGDKSAVKKIQRALKKNGYYRYVEKRYLKVDGIYHKWTFRAVKQYQKANGLKVTGKVDYETAKKLKII